MADDLDPAAVARAAEAMSDYLTMLGVDPDDVGEGVAAGTTAHVLARAALTAARDGEVAECAHPGGGDVDKRGLCAWHRPAAPTVTTEQRQAAVMILHSDQCPEDPDEGEDCGCDGGHYERTVDTVLDALGVEVRKP